MGPEFENGDGRLRPSRQQRLPGAEGPPDGGTLNRSTPRRLRRSYSTLAGPLLLRSGERTAGAGAWRLRGALLARRGRGREKKKFPSMVLFCKKSVSGTRTEC